MTTKIDILTVSYHSRDLLKANWRYFNEINGEDFKFEWHIIENSLRDDKKVNGFIYHEGIRKKVDPIRIARMKLGSGSVHHGMGLNVGVKYLDQKADLWLVVDPDFFFLVPIKRFIDHVLTNDLWFYGAAYTNYRKRLIKDFPCAFCMFINPKHVDKDVLDFSVGFENKQQCEEGWYPDTGFKIMHKYRFNAACKYNVFPHSDNNTYKIGKEVVATHLRAKIDKLPKFLHNRTEAVNINIKGMLKDLKGKMENARKTSNKI